jgi:hypothetical protein
VPNVVAELDEQIMRGTGTAGHDVHRLADDGMRSTADDGQPLGGFGVPAGDVDGDGVVDVLGVEFILSPEGGYEFHVQDRDGVDGRVRRDVVVPKPMVTSVLTAPSPIRFTFTTTWFLSLDVGGDGIIDHVQLSMAIRQGAMDGPVDVASQLLVVDGRSGKIWESRQSGYALVDDRGNLLLAEDLPTSLAVSEFDGHVELLAGTSDQVGGVSRSTITWLDPIAGTSSSFETLDVGQARAFAPIGDLDGDGAVDVLGHASTASATLLDAYTHDGAKLWSTEAAPLRVCFALGFPLTGAGRADPVISGYDENFDVGEITAIDGRSGAILWTEDPNTSFRFVEDVDGDRGLDIASVDPTTLGTIYLRSGADGAAIGEESFDTELTEGAPWLYGGAGSAVTASLVHASGAIALGSGRVQIGDFDGDGVGDLMLGVQNADEAELLYLSGATMQPLRHAVGPTEGAFPWPAFADADGDGADDWMIRSAETVSFVRQADVDPFLVLPLPPGAVISWPSVASTGTNDSARFLSDIWYSTGNTEMLMQDGAGTTLWSVRYGV